MEDVFDEPEDYDQAMAQREWDRLHERHGNAGYLEGLEEAKEVNLQQGFDDGYLCSALIGKRIGLLNGQLSVLLSVSDKIERDKEIKNELNELYQVLQQKFLYESCYPESAFSAAMDKLGNLKEDSQQNVFELHNAVACDKEELESLEKKVLAILLKMKN